MALSHLFWTGFFRRKFSKQLSALTDTLEVRLLPVFADIEKEAEGVSEEVWQAIMSSPGTGDEDPGDFAEAADEAGVSHYLLLERIRQSILNLFSVALYRAFEQQIMFFHRKEVLHQGEENNPKLLDWKNVVTRLKDLGIDITHFASWRKVEELRLLANTVKHAEGSAAHKLQAVRPDLFTPPGASGMTQRVCFAQVFQPLVGEDVYVSMKDIKDYGGALIEFWRELSRAMAEA